MNSQLIKYGGDLAVGAYGIANTFGSLLVMFIIGVCQGMQPIAGYSYGAQRFERLKEVYTLTMKVNVLCGLVGTLLVIFIPRYLVAAFTSDPDLLDIGEVAIRYLVIMFPFIGFTITNSQFFMSIDKPWVAIVTGLSRQVLFLAPMCYILPSVFTAVGWNGLTGVWASATICDVLGAVLAASLLYYNRKVFSVG
jgi:Na+-driven multidrug efflux pump